jgi:hypothetical protein
MTEPTFVKLNSDWNAEPNAPAPDVAVTGDQVILRFYLNYMLYPRFAEEEVGSLVFSRCSRWRLGETNDKGWHMGKSCYARIAPTWGEFYELIGEDPALDLPIDWKRISSDARKERHFLFYLRDNTFECVAADWSFEVDEADTKRRASIAQ